MQSDSFIRQFWRRFTESRGAIGGEVWINDEHEAQLLGDWKVRVREKIGDFLREYEPDPIQFAQLVRHRGDWAGDEDRMRWLLKCQASYAFADWLRKNDIPSSVASAAALVYEFHFEVRKAA